eukprot:TRINITY_DN3135_c0_g1_i2.p5 TRINITY_DN3135_c0_g1~~TRINITY_DN3135_c0_g1_i2.p5  ORF type:complete len:100 (+),score=43.46 TRINITY_DN3135_c0_g1_i2:345-644(+)
MCQFIGVGACLRSYDKHCGRRLPFDAVGAKAEPLVRRLGHHNKECVRAIAVDAHHEREKRHDSDRRKRRDGENGEQLCGKQCARAAIGEAGEPFSRTLR